MAKISVPCDAELKLAERIRNMLSALDLVERRVLEISGCDVYSGMAVRAWREARGLTAEDVGAWVGLTGSRVLQYERGHGGRINLRSLALAIAEHSSTRYAAKRVPGRRRSADSSGV